MFVTSPISSTEVKRCLVESSCSTELIVLAEILAEIEILKQLRNASAPMLVTLSGIVIDVRLVQPQNAPAPILVTLSGIVIALRLLQLENAASPILVTLLGIVTEKKLSQYANATPPILVTLKLLINSGISK